MQRGQTFLTISSWSPCNSVVNIQKKSLLGEVQPSGLFPATCWPNTSCLPQLAICCFYTVPNHFQKAYINLNQGSLIIILFMHKGFPILKKALLFGHHAQLKFIFNLHILEAFVNICLKILFFHELYKPKS